MRVRGPSPAMLVALLALFIALGGSSYAALRLPRNSVGSAQLKNNSVTSPKVKAGSLLLSDFQASQWSLLRGPQGERGPQGSSGAPGLDGARGAPGAAGVSGYERVETIQNVSPGDTSIVAFASCPAGKKLLGGGVAVQDPKFHVTFALAEVDNVYALRAFVLPGQTITASSQAFVQALCANVG